MLTAPLARSLATPLATSLAGRGGSLLPPLPTMPALIVYGQSLAIGDTKNILTGGAGPSATHKMLSSTPSNGLTRFNLYDGGAAVIANQLNALEEKYVALKGQTILTSALEGMSRPWLGMSGGIGATALAGLDIGSNPYIRLTQNMGLMPGLGATPAAMIFWQGQNDNISTTKSDYKALLTAFKADVIAASGNENFIFGVVSPSGTNSATPTFGATLAIAEMIREGTIKGIATDYFLPFQSNDLHPWPEGQYWMGLYVQRWLKLAAVGKTPDLMRMVSATKSGATVNITCSMPPTVDTTNYHLVTQWGFRVADSVGGGNIAVNAIATNGNQITLTLASAPTGNAIIRYALNYPAINGWNTTNFNAAGNVYSASADRGSILGKTYPLHHWMIGDQIESA